MDKNRVFHEMIGGKWREYPASLDIHGIRTNPDYAADPRLVLREMMKREDWDRFVEYIYHKQPSDINRLSPYAELVFNYIPNITGKLRDAGIEWMRKEKDHD